MLNVKFYITLKAALLAALLHSVGCSNSSGGRAGSPAGEDDLYITQDLSETVPGAAAWEARMKMQGRRFCDRQEINNLSTWEGGVWYYDGIRVYYQIAEYTGDPFWRSCAEYVKEVYLKYITESAGRVGGWRVFPHGLYLDYHLTGDEASREGVILLATKSPFAEQGGGAAHELSRETAYLIHAYLLSGKLQAPTNRKLQVAVDNALGHIDQWFVSKSAEYVNPFMAGLTMEALISYYEETGDPRVPDAVRTAADWLFREAWQPSERAFKYVICRDNSQGKCPADEADSVELNLLIAPAYAWLYKITGDPKYREQGDEIFLGGVSGAKVAGGKQFSQNYRWSFDYIKWRAG